MDQDELIMTDLFFLNNFEEHDEFTEYMQKDFHDNSSVFFIFASALGANWYIDSRIFS